MELELAQCLYWKKHNLYSVKVQTYSLGLREIMVRLASTRPPGGETYLLRPHVAAATPLTCFSASGCFSLYSFSDGLDERRAFQEIFVFGSRISFASYITVHHFP